MLARTPLEPRAATPQRRHDLNRSVSARNENTLATRALGTCRKTAYIQATSSEKNMAARNPYEVLGVKKEATADDIRKAYRALAKKHHPDLNPGNKQAEALFKEISAAYDLLSDADKRARFDRGEIDEAGNEKPRAYAYQDFAEGAPGAKYRTSQENMSPEDLDDLFSFFGRGGFGQGWRRAWRARRGRDHPHARRRPAICADRRFPRCGERRQAAAGARAGQEPRCDDPGRCARWPGAAPRGAGRAGARRRPGGRCADRDSYCASRLLQARGRRYPYSICR